MPHRPSRLSCLALLGATAWLPAACNAGGSYPSLAPRPIEKLSLAEPDRPVPPPPVADPAAVARFAPLIAHARRADVSFRRTLEEERGSLAAGRGAAEGSDAWTAAQVSLSRIETVRAPVARILSTLDAARSAPPTETNSGEEIAATQAFDQVQQIDSAEETLLSRAWPKH